MLIEQLRNILILVALLIVGLVINIVFFPNNPNNPVCPDDYVDWDIAVTALSQHFIDLSKKNPDIDFGPADIKQHFAENCEEDLKIYNEYIAKSNLEISTNKE